MNPFGSLLICVAGWMNRNQQDVIAYLQEEIRVLREQLDKKPRFNDAQRTRLATKAKRTACGQINHPSDFAAAVPPLF
jgi:Tfp pilus assembly protein PilN